MTVLDVHPVGYGVAAEALGDEVATGAVTQGRRLTGTLSSCYGMAGTDDIGAAWAASYDSAAASAVATLRELVGAGYALAALLEQSAINYAAAEAACVSDETAAESATRWRTAFAPALADLPSAVGGGVAAPSGWSMLAHLINWLWPNGHQDLLDRAADAWRTAGDGVRDLVPAVDRAIAAVREQRAPEVADAVTVLAAYRRQLAAFADECTAIASSCADYAHHLDEAHSRIIHECVEFIDATVATEMAGGLFVALTVGLSEVAAQGVVGAAAARAAEAIKAAISTLQAVAVGVAADLDAATIRLAALSRDVRPTLSRTVQQSEVVRPGVAGQVPPTGSTAADIAYEHIELYGSRFAVRSSGHAAIHQFPGIRAGKSQFFDDVDMAALEVTRGAVGVAKRNGLVEFVMHAPRPIGIDRTTGLETAIYTVVRKKNGDLVTMYPGTSARS